MGSVGRWGQSTASFMQLTFSFFPKSSQRAFRMDVLTSGWHAGEVGCMLSPELVPSWWRASPGLPLLVLLPPPCRVLDHTLIPEVRQKFLGQWSLVLQGRCLQYHCWIHRKAGTFPGVILPSIPVLAPLRAPCWPQRHAPRWCWMSCGRGGWALLGAWSWSWCFCDQNHCLGCEKSLSFAGTLYMTNVAWWISLQNDACLGGFPEAMSPTGSGQQPEPSPG